VQCNTTSLVTWPVHPFGLVSIWLGEKTRKLADDYVSDLVTSPVTHLVTCVACLVTSLLMRTSPNG